MPVAGTMLLSSAAVTHVSSDENVAIVNSAAQWSDETSVEVGGARVHGCVGMSLTGDGVIVSMSLAVPRVVRVLVAPGAHVCP